MKLERIAARTEAERERAATEGGARLRAGRLIVHPTSTVYGLGARPEPARDAEIARLKGRSPEEPLIRLAASRAAVLELLPAARWTPEASRLAEAFWPGPLTLVLDDGTERGVAVRVDAHPLIGTLLAEAGCLMTSTSFNRSGEPPARSSGAVSETAAGMPETEEPAVLLDAGDLPRSAPSTVVSLLEGGVRVLREGALAATTVLGLVGSGTESRAKGRAARGGEEKRR